MPRSGILLFVLLAGTLTAERAAFADPAPFRFPDWVAAAIAAPAARAPDSLHAQVLWLEHVVEPGAGAGGRLRMRERGVMRVLDRTGGRAAQAAIPYDRASASVTAFVAWTQQPGGPVSAAEMREATDLTLADWGSLASDLRLRLLTATGETPPGTLFAWEWTVEEESFVADRLIVFGGPFPVAHQREEVIVPAGDSLHWRGHGSAAAPERSGTHWVWERRDIPALPREPLSAQRTPPENQVVWWQERVVPGVGQGLHFESWRELSAWMYGWTTPRAEVTEPVLARARAELGAAPAHDALARVRALARVAQDVRYASVEIGLAHGEGYRPHAATEVLAAGYGDCKDKAGLFCALARAAGFEAWLVTVNSTGRERVQPDWPTPQQFDHCIAAVRLPEAVPVPAALETQAHGTLVFFDPTDPATPFGWLPEEEQGSWGLIVHPDQGALLRLPVASRAHESGQWRMDAELDSTGALHGQLRAWLAGTLAARTRVGITRDRDAYGRRLAGALTDWLGPCDAQLLEVWDHPDSNRLGYGVRFRAGRFAHVLEPGRLGFRSAAFLQRDLWSFPDLPRTTPLALWPVAMRDSMVIALPDGWQVETLPASVSDENDFGGYHAGWAQSGRDLRFHHELWMRPVTLPAARYPELTRWWNAHLEALRQAVVLRRR